MNTKTFTPGPLFAHPDQTGIAWHISNRADDDDDHPNYIRTARTTDTPNAQRDATLYAAAPDLLAVCQALVDHDANGRFGRPDFPTVVNMARKAIGMAVAGAGVVARGGKGGAA